MRLRPPARACMQASLAASTQSSETSPFAGFLADPAEGWWVDPEPPQQQAPRLRPLHVPPRSSASSVGTRGSNPSTERTRGSSSGDGGGSGPGLSSPEGLSRQGSGGAGPPMERIGEPDDVFHAEQGAPGTRRTDGVNEQGLGGRDRDARTGASLCCDMPLC